MLTFHEVVNGFLDSTRHRASWVVYRRLCTLHFDAWPTHPTFLSIEAWHGQLAATPHQANKALSFLKAAYTWAIRRGLYPGPNPATGIKQHRVFSRERAMTSLEVGLLLNALDTTLPKHSALAEVLLTTGCRLSEALRMAPPDVDLDTGKWLQRQTKNGKSHVTYLPRQVCATLRQLTHSERYFFDGAYGHHLSRAGAEKSWWRLRADLRLTDVRLHDFRRTFATHLYRATKDEYLVKRCINHMNKSVTAIYVRISDEEVAKALQAQADRFYALIPEATLPRTNPSHHSTVREERVCETC